MKYYLYKFVDIKYLFTCLVFMSYSVFQQKFLIIFTYNITSNNF